MKKGIKAFDFTDRNGSFRIQKAENNSYLYFPVAGEKGLKSSLTPNLGGDSMINQEAFLLEPVSVENLHNNKNGRNFWVYTDNGDVWSAVGNSAEQESRKFTAEQDDSYVHAGFMWHKTFRTNLRTDITAETTSFVPVDHNTEILVVTLKNVSGEPKQITPTAAIPIFGRSADNLRDHRNVTSMLHRIRTTKEGVLVKPTMSFDEKGHRLNHKTYYVLGFDEAGNTPESFFPTVESFLGEGGSYLKPRSVYRQETGCGAGESFEGKEAVGGLQFATRTLQSGEEAAYIVLMGIADSEEEIGEAVRRYGHLSDVNKALEETKEYWIRKVNVDFHTGDENFDNYMKWIAFQPFLRRVYGCSFLPYHDYGRGGRGWRDLWQDCLSLLFMEPGEVRNMIVANFGGVRMDGSNATIIGDGLGNFIADRNGITRVWMDHAYWPLKTLMLYIDQTGDYGILDEKVPYFKDSILWRGTKTDKSVENPDTKQYAEGRIYEGTMAEHLLVQILGAFYEVGEHGVLKLRGADWNDALDMANEHGESVAFSCAYCGNLFLLAELFRKYGEKLGKKELSLAEELGILLNSDAAGNLTKEDKNATLQKYLEAVEKDLSGKQILTNVSEVSDLLEQMGRSFRELLRKQEWITGEDGQGWFNSYYDNHCNPVERYEKEDSATRMMLTGQVFAIMGDVADEEQVGEIVSAADRYLYREEIGGYRLNTDFHEVKMDLGRMFGFAYGEKENGAVFSHMTVMFANALYGRGFAAEGYKALQTLYDASVNFEKSRIYPGIPEYFDADGRGKYPYLTGAASWYLLTMITEVFGVKGCGGDLVVKPALRKDQFDQKGEASVSLNFAGKHFVVRIVNSEGKDAGEYKVLSGMLNGKEVPLSHAILVDPVLIIPREQVEKLGEENTIWVVLG